MMGSAGAASKRCMDQPAELAARAGERQVSRRKGCDMADRASVPISRRAGLYRALNGNIVQVFDVLSTKACGRRR